MTRIKGGTRTRHRHKKILKATKGYFGARSKLYKIAHEAYLHAGEYAFAGRKLKKRDKRSLWIQRINAALKPCNISYSKFTNLLKKSNVQLDRKVLAEIAANHQGDFNFIVETVLETKSSK